jgi:hypothetical protein
MVSLCVVHDDDVARREMKNGTRPERHGSWGQIDIRLTSVKMTAVRRVSLVDPTFPLALRRPFR